MISTYDDFKLFFKYIKQLLSIMVDELDELLRNNMEKLVTFYQRAKAQNVEIHWTRTQQHIHK